MNKLSERIIAKITEKENEAKEKIKHLLRVNKLPHGDLQIKPHVLTAGFKKRLVIERYGVMRVNGVKINKPTAEGRIRLLLDWPLTDKELMKALGITIQKIHEQELIPRGTIHRFINGYEVEPFWEPILCEYFDNLRDMRA